MGVSKSLQSEPLKTDGPLCVNFRRIKQGGYKKGMIIFAECTKNTAKRGISFCQKIRENALFKAGKQCKNIVFPVFFCVPEGEWKG